MDASDYKALLTDYLPEIMEDLKKQLESDQERWGDTWKHRPIGDYQGRGDQVKRAFDRISDYYDQYRYNNIPMPWLKVMGEAVICYVRELESKKEK